MRPLIYLLVFLALPSFAQEIEYHHTCQVFADDLAGFAELQQRMSKMTREEIQKASAELEKASSEFGKELGRFDPVLGEEARTTQAFPLPGTDRIVTVTVFYTDESLPLSSASMTVAVAVSSKEVVNAIVEPGFAITEVGLEADTYTVISKQVVVVDGKQWVIGADCKTMSPEDRKKLLEKKRDL